MSNDLLFSVLPRNNKAAVSLKPSTSPVAKEQTSERINDKDKESRQQKQHAEHDAHAQLLTSSDEGDDDGEGKKSDNNQSGHLDIYI